jgi:hypothetical protein
MATEDNAGNRDTIQRWINQWYPLAARAVNALASILRDDLEHTDAPPAELMHHEVDRYYRDYLRSMKLEVA